MRPSWIPILLAALLPSLATGSVETHLPPSQRGQAKTYARRISVEELEAMQRRALAAEADASAQRFGLFKVERRGRVGRRGRVRVDERQNGNALVDSILGGATLASDALAPTQGVGGGDGGSTPAALAGSVSGGKHWGGGGNGNGVQVTEIESSQQTAAGLVTVKCLILSNDPSDMFCETLLNGQHTGSGMTGSSGSGSGSSSGSTQSEPESSASSSSAVDTTTTTSQADAAAAASTSATATAVTSAADQSTASVTSASQDAAVTSSASMTQSIDAVVGGAPTSAAASDTTSADSATAAATSSSVVAAAAVTAPQLVTASSTDAAVTAESTATGQADAGAAVASVNFTVNAPATTIAAAANNAASTTVDPIPGQSLQVLPIGLGIFGGLAALTLVIVAYFLWQRKRYKGQFRRRKLAEEAAPMGRGGAGYGSAV